MTSTIGGGRFRLIAITIVLSGLFSGLILAGFPEGAKAETVATEQELVVNGTFETGVGGWRTNHSYTSLTTGAPGHSGSGSAALTTRAGRDAVLNDVKSTVASTVAGDEFGVSAWVRTDKAGLEGQLRIREVLNGNVRTVAQRYTLNGTGWQRVELSVVAASTGAKFDLNVLAWNFSSGQKLWVDDVSLKKVAPGVEESTVEAPGATTSTTSTPSTTTTSTTVQPTTTPAPPTTSTTMAPTSTTTTSTTAVPGRALIALGVWNNSQLVSGSWLDRHKQSETQFGSYEGHWRQFKSPGHNGQLSSDEEAALASGKRLFSNWKVAANGQTWANVAAGGQDGVIIAAAKDWAPHCKTGNQCWITFWHEPENDLGAAGSGMTAADYVAFQRHVVTLWRTHAPSVRIVWTMAGSESKRALHPQLWPGAQYADYIGHDPYVRADEDPLKLAQKVIERSTWFRANLAPLPVVVPEWGTDLSGVRGTVDHRAAAINEVTRRLPEIMNAGVIELSHYNSREHYISWVDLSCPDGQAFKSLKTATEAR